MAVLSLSEAKAILRIDGTDTDTLLIILLPAIDSYLATATGKDQSSEPLAKVAAQMLLVAWYENPGMAGKIEGELQYGLTNIITQLQAKALPEVVE